MLLNRYICKNQPNSSQTLFYSHAIKFHVSSNNLPKNWVVNKSKSTHQCDSYLTRNGANSSSDLDKNCKLPQPPPSGSPKLYQTAEFVAKFACKAELKVAS